MSTMLERLSAYDKKYHKEVMVSRVDMEELFKIKSQRWLNRGINRVSARKFIDHVPLTGVYNMDGDVITLPAICNVGLLGERVLIAAEDHIGLIQYWCSDDNPIYENHNTYHSFDYFIMLNKDGTWSLACWAELAQNLI